MSEQLAYRPDHAARIAGIGRSKLFEEIRLGRLKAFKAGRRTIITAAALTEWLERLPRIKTKGGQ